MNRDSLVGRRVAVVLMARNAGGEDSLATRAGTIIASETRLLFRHAKGSLELSDDWAFRIGPVEPEASRTLFAAEYVLPLQVEDLSREERVSLEAVGLELPRA
jgi:hypothetical protein